jgi:hypothetical protein
LFEVSPQSVPASTDPTNVYYVECTDEYPPSPCLPPITAFPSSPQDANDWGIATEITGIVHVVRARLDGTYEAYADDLAKPKPIPAAARAGRTGLPLAGDGNVYVFDQDATQVLRVLEWDTDAWKWSAWTVIDSSEVVRTFLSVASVSYDDLVSSGGFGVIWTYATPQGNAIQGMRYLPP